MRKSTIRKDKFGTKDSDNITIIPPKKPASKPPAKPAPSKPKKRS